MLNGGDGRFSLCIGGKRKVNESECSAVNLDVSGPKKSKTKQSPLKFGCHLVSCIRI